MRVVIGTFEGNEFPNDPSRELFVTKIKGKELLGIAQTLCMVAGEDRCYVLPVDKDVTRVYAGTLYNNGYQILV